jgi:hypothetical protein
VNCNNTFGGRGKGIRASIMEEGVGGSGGKGVDWRTWTWGGRGLRRVCILHEVCLVEVGS